MADRFPPLTPEECATRAEFYLTRQHPDHPPTQSQAEAALAYATLGNLLLNLRYASQDDFGS